MLQSCFRPLRSGELNSGSLLLSWLADEENRELIDEIENVNHAMLDQLLDKSIYLAALFCEYFELKTSTHRCSATIIWLLKQRHICRVRSNTTIPIFVASPSVINIFFISLY